MELNKIYNEDCLIGMSAIPDKSVDMILSDLPYGTIKGASHYGNKVDWDVVINTKELFEQLIKTYSNSDDLVLDVCMGSGTTAIACINTNRNYIGFELDEEYYKASIERINNHVKDKQIDLFEILDN